MFVAATQIGNYAASCVLRLVPMGQYRYRFNSINSVGVSFGVPHQQLFILMGEMEQQQMTRDITRISSSAIQNLK